MNDIVLIIVSACANEILITGQNMLAPSSKNISVRNHPNVFTPFDACTTNNNSPPTVELNIKVNQLPKFATEKSGKIVEQQNVILAESNGAEISKKHDLVSSFKQNGSAIHKIYPIMRLHLKFVKTLLLCS